MLGLGLSLLTGGSVSPEYVKLSKAFVTRVEADGGTVDSFACLKTDMAYLTSNPDAPAGYFVEFSAATVGSSAEFRITLTGGAGYTYTYAVTDTQANEVTGTGVMSGNIQSVTADLSTLVDGTVTVAVYLSGAGGDGLIVTDTATLVGYTGLLDTYSGAAAAYSLRLLDTSYTGNAIKVRRSSDNAEQDIAFVNNELDTATLESFASGTDAFVTTWYDQSGSGNDATQTTASNQPKIVSSGSTILENGKAAVEFDNSSEYEKLIFSDSVDTYSGAPITYVSVQKILGYANGFTKVFANTPLNTSVNGKFELQFRDDNDTFIAVGNTLSIREIIAKPNQFLNSVISDGTNVLYSFNNTTTFTGLTGTPSATIPDSNAIGALGTRTFTGRIQEMIFYQSDESTNRTNIETNINDFYNIY